MNSKKNLQFRISKKVLGIVFLFSFELFAGPYSVPTPPTLQEKVKESDYIVHAEVDNIQQTSIKKGTFSVQCNLKIKRAYKAKAPLSPELDVSFIIMPGSYGKMLIEAPKKGEYIVFLQEKSLRDPKGRNVPSIVLYDPNPFAFQAYTTQLEQQVLKLIE